MVGRAAAMVTETEEGGRGAHRNCSKGTRVQKLIKERRTENKDARSLY